MRKGVLEVCIDSVESARNALKGEHDMEKVFPPNIVGADQLEVCSSLALGGLTPSVGLVSRLRELFPSSILMCMVRPRPGNFVYSEDELEVMKSDMKALGAAGATGFVFGILTRENVLDIDRMEELFRLSHGLSCTLHRAFDLTADWRQALHEAVSLGFKTILTSGQKATASEGALLLKEIVGAGRDKAIEILIGSGVNSKTLPALIDQTGGKMFHGSASVVLPATTSPPPFAMGSAETETLKETSTTEVVAMKKFLREIS